MTLPREGLKPGQTVWIDGRWATFNYLVGRDQALITQDDDRQRLVNTKDIKQRAVINTQRRD